MPRARKADAVVEESSVEETVVTPDPEDPDTQEETPSPGEESVLPSSSTAEEYAAFKSFVLDTLNALEERIRDVEVVAGNHFVAAVQGVPHGASESFVYPDPRDSVQDEDDGVPEYVAEYERAFNPYGGDESDGTPWFRS